MNSSMRRYSTAFTCGALLKNEADIFIASIKDYNAFLNDNEEVDMNILSINAESSKKRICLELSRRLRALDSKYILSVYESLDETDRSLVMFYAACRYYPIIADFMLEVVLNKWYNMDYELLTDDFQYFLYQKMDSHPELEDISDGTKYKCSQVVLKMLKDLGIFSDNKLQKCEFDRSLLHAIVKNGDSWFLEILFLSETERKDIIEG